MIFLGVMLDAGTHPDPDPISTACEAILKGERVNIINPIGYAEMVVYEMKRIDIKKLPQRSEQIWYLSTSRLFKEFLRLRGWGLRGDALYFVKLPENYEHHLLDLRKS